MLNKLNNTSQIMLLVFLLNSIETNVNANSFKIRGDTNS